jgi:hypothetical protein
VAVWAQLSRERPASEEYKEGLAWSQERLQKL